MVPDVSSICLNSININVVSPYNIIPGLNQAKV